MLLYFCYILETFYWFGDNNYTEWEELFNEYKEPPYQLPEHTGAYSFGIAGRKFFLNAFLNLKRLIFKFRKQCNTNYGYIYY